MRTHIFFIQNPVIGNEIAVRDKNLLNQWEKVLRLKEGDKVFVFDNSEFKFECSIKNFSSVEAHLSVLKKVSKPWRPSFDLEIVQAVIKKDRFEWLLEKGTELGVNKFSPVVCRRSIKHKINIERAEKILRESSEQSGRSKLPEIGEVRTLKNFLEGLKEDRFYFALSPKGEKFDKKNLFANFSSADLEKKKVSAFIGPEGGFDEKELEGFQERNIAIYSLSGQVLRSETAAVSIAALVLLNC
jgi:16S rRNA (uracil1498-N3)-methyltransferase